MSIIVNIILTTYNPSDCVDSNLLTPYSNIIYMTFLIYLECTSCGNREDHTVPQKLCTKCGMVLYPRYDLEKAKETLTKDSMHKRKRDIWRMQEIMPCSEPYQFTLGEGGTPLLKLKNQDINLFVKDEGFNPTGSFKARGLCAAVSRGVELGLTEFVIPTAGNAGAALSAYSARTNTKAHIYTPKDVPEMILQEMIAYGAEINLVDGLITDAGKKAKEDNQDNRWFDVSTLKEPYRVEGKKTMGLELAEQFDWELPDVIIYPTGGGTGIVGMIKAFDELEQLGFIDDFRPKMVSVQSTGCAPIVKAFENKLKSAEPWERANTKAAGLRVPAAIADYLILDAIYSTGGTAIAIPDDEILLGMKKVAKEEGLFVSPEAAATFVAAEKLTENGWLDKGSQVVLFDTASGLTTPEMW